MASQFEKTSPISSVWSEYAVWGGGVVCSNQTSETKTLKHCRNDSVLYREFKSGNTPVTSLTTESRSFTPDL